MATMPKQRPPYLQKQTSRHGKTAWYVRVGRGPKVRIRGDYDSPEFKAAYQAAVSGDKPPAPGAPNKDTLAWLIGLHRKSSYWSDLSPATRRQREGIFRQILKTAGKSRLSSIGKQAIIHGRDRRKATPSQARHFVDAMRSLFKWAIDANLVKDDPTAGVTTKKPNKAGIPVWTDADIEKYEKRWPRGTRERVMFDLFLYTGLRIGDVARLGKQHARNGVIEIDTEKTGMRVTIPILAPLAATIKAGPTGDLAYISTKTGKPILKNSLGNVFREACRLAGVNKSAHGLRKAAATHAADQGATVAELEAIFGWSGGQMAAHYTRSANRKALASKAMAKLDRAETGTSMLPPSGVVVAPAEKHQSKQGRKK